MKNLPKPQNELQERIASLKERLNLHVEDFISLKRTIIHRILAWDEDAEGIELDDVGTFVMQGMNDRLSSALDNVNEQIEIKALGWVILKDTKGTTRFGNIRIPYSDSIARENWINTNALDDIERMTFVPVTCNRHISDPQEATLDSNGLFQLTEEHEKAARALITLDYIRSYIQIACSIHTDEKPSSYSDVRVEHNIRFAFNALTWLEKNFPPSITQDHQRNLTSK